MTQTATSSIETVKALYEAFARGDIETVMAAMADDVEWYEAEGNPWHPGHAFIGPQQVLENVIARIPAEYDDFRIESRRLLGSGDTVVMEGRYHATRCKATGKSLDAQVVHIWDFRDGKVVRWQQYVDTRQLAEVLGA
jgi:uncharacterized protein